jgi:hypothetical protein
MIPHTEIIIFCGWLIFVAVRFKTTQGYHLRKETHQLCQNTAAWELIFTTLCKKKNNKFKWDVA